MILVRGRTRVGCGRVLRCDSYISTVLVILYFTFKSLGEDFPTPRLAAQRDGKAVGRSGLGKRKQRS